MGNHAFPRVGDEISGPPSFGLPTFVEPVKPAESLSDVADWLDTAVDLLRRGNLAAGSELVASAATRMRSLLGDVDTDEPEPFVPDPAPGIRVVERRRSTDGDPEAVAPLTPLMRRASDHIGRGLGGGS